MDISTDSYHLVGLKTLSLMLVANSNELKTRDFILTCHVQEKDFAVLQARGAAVMFKCLINISILCAALPGCPAPGRIQNTEISIRQ